MFCQQQVTLVIALEWVLVPLMAAETLLPGLGNIPLPTALLRAGVALVFIMIQAASSPLLLAVLVAAVALDRLGLLRLSLRELPQLLLLGAVVHPEMVMAGTAETVK
jgi:hypothetical protein